MCQRPGLLPYEYINGSITDANDHNRQFLSPTLSDAIRANSDPPMFVKKHSHFYIPARSYCLIAPGRIGWDLVPHTPYNTLSASLSRITTWAISLVISCLATGVTGISHAGTGNGAVKEDSSSQPQVSAIMVPLITTASCIFRGGYHLIRGKSFAIVLQ